MQSQDSQSDSVQGSEELTKLMIYSFSHSKAMAGYSWRTAKIEKRRGKWRGGGGVWRGGAGQGGGERTEDCGWHWLSSELDRICYVDRFWKASERRCCRKRYQGLQYSLRSTKTLLGQGNVFTIWSLLDVWGKRKRVCNQLIISTGNV